MIELFDIMMGAMSAIVLGAACALGLASISRKPKDAPRVTCIFEDDGKTYTIIEHEM